jgi:hypothetical protein
MIKCSFSVVGKKQCGKEGVKLLKVGDFKYMVCLEHYDKWRNYRLEMAESFLLSPMVEEDD